MQQEGYGTGGDTPGPGPDREATAMTSTEAGPQHAAGSQDATGPTAQGAYAQEAHAQAPTQQFGGYGPSYGAYGTGTPPPTSTYPPFAGGGPPPPRRPRRGLTPIIVATVVAGLIGGGVGFGGAYAAFGSGSGSTPAAALGSSADPNVDAAPADGTVAGAAAKAAPSAVDIQVRTARGVAEGSGVILTADGDVLTNNHVVSGVQGNITVTLADGSTHTARVVGTSPSYDLAVIKLDGVSGLTAATLGRTPDVRVGEQVVAIGSPQGLTGTVTSGIVSALNRTVAAGGEQGEAPVVYNGLQTDASINQGNSGGPLVNLAGQVVGINSAILSSGENAGSIGLGFAIPVDTARRVAQELMTNGTATKPQLGVQGALTNSATGATEGTGGARVAGVQPGTAAANAGIKAGDVVTKVGDTPVSDFTDLVARVGNYTPGQTVPLTVTSPGTPPRVVQVTLGSVPDTAPMTVGGAQQGSNSDPFGGLNPFGGGN